MCILDGGVGSDNGYFLSSFLSGNGGFSLPTGEVINRRKNLQLIIEVNITIRSQN